MSHVTVLDARGGEQALGPTEERLAAAALRCIARWGVAKTTLDDVAREAGCSRATAYRAVPGGRDALLALVARSEVDRLKLAVAAAMAAAGEDLGDVLVAGVTTATAHLRDHEALQWLVAHEPELVLPCLAFHRMDAVLAAAAECVAPALERFMPPELARRTGEWLARLVCSAAFGPPLPLDLAEPEGARRLLDTFVLPGLEPTP